MFGWFWSKWQLDRQTDFITRVLGQFNKKCYKHRSACAWASSTIQYNYFADRKHHQITLLPLLLYQKLKNVNCILSFLHLILRAFVDLNFCGLFFYYFFLLYFCCYYCYIVIVNFIVVSRLIELKKRWKATIFVSFSPLKFEFSNLMYAKCVDGVCDTNMIKKCGKYANFLILKFWFTLIQFYFVFQQGLRARHSLTTTKKKRRNTRNKFLEGKFETIQKVQKFLFSGKRENLHLSQSTQLQKCLFIKKFA